MINQNNDIAINEIDIELVEALFYVASNMRARMINGAVLILVHVKKIF